MEQDRRSELLPGTATGSQRTVPSTTPKGPKEDELNRPNVLGLIQEALTDRERDVLFAFVELLSVKRVAAALGSRPQTIRNQLASIEKKLACDSRIELAMCVAVALSKSE